MLTSALELTHTFTCSNQFLNQEPGSNDVIKQFAQDKGFTGFLMDKIDVNGYEASPVYTFLKVGLHKALLALSKPTLLMQQLPYCALLALPILPSCPVFAVVRPSRLCLSECYCMRSSMSASYTSLLLALHHYQLIDLFSVANGVYS